MARVDHQQRRHEIAEAVWRLLESGGIEAASVRGVVAETGLSSGSIRFFFSSQAGLHTFAMATLADRVEERIARHASEPDLARRAVAMVGELMPLRDDTARELGVWMAFLGRARHDSALARIVAQQATTVRAFLVSVVGDLVDLGLQPADTDVDAEARLLNAVVDGLTLELLTAPDLVGRDEAFAVLHRTLLPDRPITPFDEESHDD